jgi:hypothetical protein
MYVTKAKRRNRNELNILALILSVGKCLSDLTIIQHFSGKCPTISSLNLRYTSSISSTLIKLTINVLTFDDCLYLLNGCFESLSTLIIDIMEITRLSSNIDNTVSISAIIAYKQICL